jgi:hypothetical protein
LRTRRGAKNLFVFDGGVSSADRIETITIDGTEITASGFYGTSTLKVQRWPDWQTA